LQYDQEAWIPKSKLEPTYADIHLKMNVDTASEPLSGFHITNMVNPEGQPIGYFIDNSAEIVEGIIKRMMDK
jgi:hypothetical protein